MNEEIDSLVRLAAIDPTIENLARLGEAYLHKYQIPKEKYEILQTLILSTAHLNEEDIKFLNSYTTTLEWPDFFYKYGWHLKVPDPYDMPEAINAFPSNIANLLKLAVDLECSYIRFDSDGLIFEDLPRFEW